MFCDLHTNKYNQITSKSISSPILIAVSFVFVAAAGRQSTQNNAILKPIRNECQKENIVTYWIHLGIKEMINIWNGRIYGDWINDEHAHCIANASQKSQLQFFFSFFKRWNNDNHNNSSSSHNNEKQCALHYSHLLKIGNKHIYERMEYIMMRSTEWRIIIFCNRLWFQLEWWQDLSRYQRQRHYIENCDFSRLSCCAFVIDFIRFHGNAHKFEILSITFSVWKCVWFSSDK